MTKAIISFLLLLPVLESCSNNEPASADEEQAPVKIFVSWPGSIYPPHYYWPLGDNKPHGIEPELIELILDKAGLKYEYIADFDYSGEPDPRTEAITSGAADIAIRGFSITPERKREINFSKPYYVDGLGALVQDSSRLYKLDDLEDKKIYVTEYTTAYSWVLEKFPSATIITHHVDSVYIQPEDLLLMDSIDAYILDYSFLKFQTKNYPQLRVFEEKFTTEQLAIGISKENTKLLEQINKAIDQLKASGELEKITRRFEQ